MPLVAGYRPAFEQAVEHLKGELNTIRGNRAHASLVEEVRVEAYGSELRLKEVATITIPEPRTIVVQPWDKTILKDIERSLAKADTGLAIVNDGAVVRLTLPPLTAESRQALTKVLHQKLEAGRVQLRQVREKARGAILQAERDKSLSEDDRFAAQEDLDELVRDYLAKVAELGERKEAEVMTV